MKNVCLLLSCLVCLTLLAGICPAQSVGKLAPVPALVSDADPAGTNVRTAPSGDVAGVIPFSQGLRLVLILESKNGWFRVKPFPLAEYGLADTTTTPTAGWMHGSVLALNASPSEDGDPWFYAAPRHDDKGGVQIPAFTPLRPLERQGEWFRVRIQQHGKKAELWAHEERVISTVSELVRCQANIAKTWSK